MKIYGLAQRVPIMGKDNQVCEGPPYIWTADEAGTEFPPFFESSSSAQLFIDENPRRGKLPWKVVELDLRVELNLPPEEKA